MRSATRIALVVLLAGASALHADLLVYDGFGVGDGGYTNGVTIDGQGYGSGWSGNWAISSGTTNDFNTITGAVAPTIVQSIDGELVRTGGNSLSIGVGRGYATNFGGATPVTTEAWFSLGLQRNVHNRELIINPFDTTTSPYNGQFMGLHAANGSADLYARIRYGSSSEVIDSAVSNTLTLGTEYFIVGQALFNDSGTPDVLNVYVLDADTFDGTLPGTPTMTVSYDLDSTFSAWSFGSQNPLGNTDVLVFDELRIGTEVGDVIVIPPARGTVIAIQ